jgi:hypothetical protein
MFSGAAAVSVPLPYVLTGKAAFGRDIPVIVIKT